MYPADCSIDFDQQQQQWSRILRHYQRIRLHPGLQGRRHLLTLKHAPTSLADALPPRTLQGSFLNLIGS